LLFYTRSDATLDGTPILGDFPATAESRRAVDADNAMFAIEQQAFCAPFASMVLNVGSYVQLRGFFFRVFCHPRLSWLANGFSDKLLDVCGDSGDLFVYMSDNIKTLVLVVFWNNMHTEILAALSAILVAAGAIVVPEVSVPLFMQFVDKLHVCRSRLLVLTALLRLVYDFLESMTPAHSLARESHWLTKMSMFLVDVYADRIQEFKDSVDFTLLFESIAMLIDAAHRDEVSALPAMLEDVRASYKHNRVFFNLLVKGVDADAFDFNEFARLPAEFPTARRVAYELRHVTSETFAQAGERLTCTHRVAIRDVVEYIIDHLPAREPGSRARLAC
jgi:hypothetical protein